MMVGVLLVNTVSAKEFTSSQELLKAYKSTQYNKRKGQLEDLLAYYLKGNMDKSYQNLSNSVKIQQLQYDMAKRLFDDLQKDIDGTKNKYQKRKLMAENFTNYVINQNYAKTGYISTLRSQLSGYVNNELNSYQLGRIEQRRKNSELKGELDFSEALYSYKIQEASLNISQQSVALKKKQLKAMELKLSQGLVKDGQVQELRTQLTSETLREVSSRVELERTKSNILRFIGLEGQDVQLNYEFPDPDNIMTLSKDQFLVLVRRNNEALNELEYKAQLYKELKEKSAVAYSKDEEALKRAKIGYERGQDETDKALKLKKLELNKAYEDYVLEIKSYELAKNEYQLAQKLKEQVDLQYQKGRISENEAFQSEIQYLQSQMSFQQAKLQIYRQGNRMIGNFYGF